MGNIVGLPTHTCKAILLMYVKFPTHAGPTWEVQPKPSDCERKPVLSSGTYIRECLDQYFSAKYF